MNKYKYIIFDLDWTLINSTHKIIDIIEDYFLENYPNYYDNARYFVENSFWMSLQEILKNIFNDKDLAEKEAKKIYELLGSLRDKVKFFPWIKEKLKNLSKNYKFFLTTWSSTKFAKQTLEDWEIKQYFEKIIWSDKILKWHDHLEIFKELSLDENFYKNSIYIWDWEMDKLFAWEKNIDFVRVWSRWTEDENRIISVTDIDKFL